MWGEYSLLWDTVSHTFQIYTFPEYKLLFILSEYYNVNTESKSFKYICFRAATNDYFDKRLVGQLFFWLIGLNNILFYWQKHTIPHSAQCPWNKLNAMKTYSA